MNSPPAHVLAERGIVENVQGFRVYGDYREDHPPSEIVHAVATGQVDVAAVWGPVAGYFARKEKRQLVVTSIVGNAEAPAYDIRHLDGGSENRQGVERAGGQRVIFACSTNPNNP
jgi:ABC-type amino acid transport substrate-binding protein